MQDLPALGLGHRRPSVCEKGVAEALQPDPTIPLGTFSAGGLRVPRERRDQGGLLALSKPAGSGDCGGSWVLAGGTYLGTD